MTKHVTGTTTRTSLTSRSVRKKASQQRTSRSRSRRPRKGAPRTGVLRRAACVAVALAAVLCVVSTLAYADTVPSTFSNTVSSRSTGGSTVKYTFDGVYQGTSWKTFGSPMQVSTAYIDMSKIKGKESTAVGKVLSPDPGFYITDDNYARYDTTRTVDGSPAQKTELRSDATNDFAGELFQFTYKDAAILSNGTRANVRFIYSNAHVYQDVRIPEYSYQGWIQLATGHQIVATIDKDRPGITNRLSHNMTPEQVDLTGQSSSSLGPGTSFSTATIGLVIDVRIQIVDDSDKPIECTFVNPITGINQRKTGAQVFKSLYQTGSHEFFSESVRINSGNVSNIYVRDNTSEPDSYGTDGTSHGYFYPVISREIEGAYEGATTFTAGMYSTNGANGTNGYYNCGFITTADSAKGASMTVISGGGNQSYLALLDQD